MKLPGKENYLLILVLVLFFSAINISVFNAKAQDSQFEKQEKPSILYIVDGKAMSAKEADKIDSGTIEMIEMIRDQNIIRKYTEEKVDIVVLITLKKSPEKDTASAETDTISVEKSN
jgi:2-polyprenyl-3-methyl-5-hydroxy-6-metoxy-1,4-benzoquinol methylase